jgi:hypothetical protein
MNTIPAIDATDSKVLQVMSNSMCKIDLPCIISEKKILEIGISYLLISSDKSTPLIVEIGRVEEADGILHIHVQDLKTEEGKCLSYNVLLDKPQDHYWFIVSMEYLIDAIVFEFMSTRRKHTK